MEAKAPTVSIIIPVYNVEKFLRKCLTSLVEQTFQDREIIAVNDGSTDHSLDILREFEQKYDFITVIDQKNRGMSKARNRGLSLARGEYICFIDSDDYVAPNFLERLYNACVKMTHRFPAVTIIISFQTPALPLNTRSGAAGY